MAPQTAITFRIDDEQLERLRALKERDGIPLNEQVRRAIDMWLQAKGAEIKTAHRRAGTRRKA